VGVFVHALFDLEAFHPDAVSAACADSVDRSNGDLLVLRATSLWAQHDRVGAWRAVTDAHAVGLVGHTALRATVLAFVLAGEHGDSSWARQAAQWWMSGRMREPQRFDPVILDDDEIVPALQLVDAALLATLSAPIAEAVQVKVPRLGRLTRDSDRIWSGTKKTVAGPVNFSVLLPDDAPDNPSAQEALASLNEQWDFLTAALRRARSIMGQAVRQVVATSEVSIVLDESHYRVSDANLSLRELTLSAIDGVDSELAPDITVACQRDGSFAGAFLSH
jgi:hypothetical protein